MIVVLVTSRYQTILNWILPISNESIHSIKVIKQSGPKVFLYVETELQQNEVHHIIKQHIKSLGGAMYVYELYGIFNGMIDYNSYMSDQTKLSTKYYQSLHKDITDNEIEEFTRIHS